MIKKIKLIILFLFTSNLYLFSCESNNTSGVESLLLNSWVVNVVANNGSQYSLKFFFNKDMNKVVVDRFRNDSLFSYEYNYFVNEIDEILVYTVDKETPAFVFKCENDNWDVFSPLEITSNFMQPIIIKE